MSEWNSLYCETCEVECSESSSNSRRALEEAIRAYAALQPILQSCYFIEVSILGCPGQSSAYFEFLDQHYNHGQIIVTPLKT